MAVIPINHRLRAIFGYHSQILEIASVDAFAQRTFHQRISPSHQLIREKERHTVRERTIP